MGVGGKQVPKEIATRGIHRGLQLSCQTWGAKICISNGFSATTTTNLLSQRHGEVGARVQEAFKERQDRDRGGTLVDHVLQGEEKWEDFYVMELLKAVSMGGDILPSRSKVEEGGGDGKGGELSYVRAPFEHVMGSKENKWRAVAMEATR
ncbi:hypothetical protein ACSQ67_016917 [Phaseolus vulgaris]